MAEVRTLTSLLQNLTVQSPQPEQSPSVVSSASFTLISGAGSAASESAAIAASDLSSERIFAAGNIGAWVERCLAGQLRGLSGREKIPLASKYYLVFRSVDLTIHDPPLVFTTWRDTKAKVYTVEGLLQLQTKKQGAGAPQPFQKAFATPAGLDPLVAQHALHPSGSFARCFGRSCKGRSRALQPKQKPGQMCPLPKSFPATRRRMF